MQSTTAHPEVSKDERGSPWNFHLYRWTLFSSLAVKFRVEKNRIFFGCLGNADQVSLSDEFTTGPTFGSGYARLGLGAMKMRYNLQAYASHFMKIAPGIS
jgi:hypothetical protein